MSNDKSCFVIAPIGDPESDTRKRSDQVLKHIIIPAAQDCGYSAIRADDIDKPGIITSQVIQHIVDDPLVIADLTERNPNVFYELAIRHAIAKPFVQIIAKGEQIPFDVAATRTIFFDHHDLDSVAEAKQKITEQIRELEDDSSDIETPISTSLDLQSLRQSEKPEDRSLAELVEEVSNIREGIGKIDTKFDRLDNKDRLDSLQHSIRRLSHNLVDEDGQSGVLSSRRARRLRPMVLDELLGFGSHVGPAIELLFVAGLLRDTVPWAHELALESYRSLQKEEMKLARERLQELEKVLEFSIHSRWGREYLAGDGKETLMALEYVAHHVGRMASQFGG
ncbi:MAG: hypothetical protein OXC31_23600 [Spirochaetaceae bacterium]|nr:hypothetical protein [Spirochaetaceae bacterium]